MFSLQIRAETQTGILFLLIFLMIFFAISEIINYTAGLYVAGLVIILEFLQAIILRKQDPYNYFVIASFMGMLVFYYFLIKTFKNKREFENSSARERFFWTLVNLSLQTLILKNKKGEVLFASESVKDLLGLKDNLPAGKDIIPLINSEDVRTYNNLLKQVLASPNERKSAEVRMSKGQKDWVWIKIEAVNLLEHYDIRAIVTSITDITFQKELDREKIDIIKEEKTARSLAEKAVADRDQFLSIASHELKTPLTTVLLQLQTTLRKISTQSLADFSGNELMNSLQIAERQSQNLSTLIKDLLNVSLTSTGRITLNKESVNLATISEMLVRKYEAEIKLSGSEVNLVIRDRIIEGNWDQVRIEQAVTNLLTNALKFGKGGKITITVLKKDNWGIFQISDHGNGIDKKIQKEIFEPFRRANNGNSIPGLGVGLFIVKQIVQAHEGQINVNSEVGKGSTFYLKLPLN